MLVLAVVWHHLVAIVHSGLNVHWGSSVSPGSLDLQEVDL